MAGGGRAQVRGVAVTDGSSERSVPGVILNCRGAGRSSWGAGSFLSGPHLAKLKVFNFSANMQIKSGFKFFSFCADEAADSSVPTTTILVMATSVRVGLSLCEFLGAASGGRRTEIDYSQKNRMMDSEGSAPANAKEYLSNDTTATSGKHYLCGYCAAFTNIAVTFPIQKVLFRQQLYGLKTKDAVQQLQKDGIRNLYRGILPPLMQKTTTLALMFGLYEDFSSLLHSHTSAPELLTRSMAAVLAGTTEAVLTPFERVQTLLQDYKHHDKFTNTYQAFKVLRVYGMREYYRGLVPILLRNGPSNALFFGLRGPIKQCLPEATSYSTHLINDFICGGLLGAMLGFLFFPVNVVKTRMQAQIGGEFQSFPKVFVKIWLERDRKLIHLFRGAHLNYHRSVLSWGIINATYEFLLKLL
ncbi:PREDICTED: solute carrier family 25 member 51 [Leptosomus discolor]|nr:PREDICTED: solute carrier family 25 member 51 [Leptosomus discolor]